MVSLIRLEMAKLKSIYILSAALCIAGGMGCALIFRTGYVFYSYINLWNQVSDVMAVVFPAAATMPVCWLLYFERKDGYLPYAFVRTGRRPYLFSKLLADVAAGGAVVFMMSLASLAFSAWVFRGSGLADAEMAQEAQSMVDVYLFGGQMVSRPFLFGLALSGWRFLLGCLYALFGFVLSMYLKNLFLIMTVPFIYGVAENFVLSVIGLPQIRMVTSFTTVGISGITAVDLLLGPAILCAVILGTYIALRSGEAS